MTPREFQQRTWDQHAADAARRILEIARVEDLGDSLNPQHGDLTSQATIPASATGRAVYRVRREGVIAGIRSIAIAAAIYDPSLEVQTRVQDGDRVQPGTILAELHGSARSILAVERPSLNLLSRLSGIATATARRVASLQGTAARLYDTRKTTPGLRLLEKYAVRCGGGHNHRTGLHDAILIKDNHLALGGHQGEPLAPAEAIRRARKFLHSLGFNETNRPMIELEVDSLNQLRDALPEQPDIVLLDNLPADQLTQAVELRNQLAPQVQLEASGGIDDQSLPRLAATGVDRISMGALTHSAVQLDIGLDWIG